MSKCHDCSQNTERDEISKLFKSLKVLVVDEKKDILASVGCLLYSCSFQVTCVDNYGAALRLLSEKENGFDLLLIDKDITGVDIHTFLRLAKNFDLLSMVMSEEDDDTLVLEALKNGAFLVLKRPLTIHTVMHIRQCVIKDIFRKHEEWQTPERDEISKFFKSLKVLVVDEKKDLLASVGFMLYSCSFEVTCVDNYGAALRLLSEKENGFHLLLIDKDITGVDVHTFLRLAKNFDLLSMVMSEEDDDTLVLEALENGAFLVLKRPLTMHTVMLVRHYVIEDIFRKHEEWQNQNTTQKAVIKEESIQDNRSFGSKRMYRGKPMKDVVRSNLDNNLVYQSSEEGDDSTKKKICMEWTQELHIKFIH